jgi:hypothetical protein
MKKIYLKKRIVRTMSKILNTRNENKAASVYNSQIKKHFLNLSNSKTNLVLVFSFSLPQTFKNKLPCKIFTCENILKNNLKVKFFVL